ncbi:trypsin-like peptidase domain-containing protein [Bacillus sp. BGMRC 2118]|nr:trypsin-like peptidase domain-containing protein [Bacillus sp. BGMRC 2118]
MDNEKDNELFEHEREDFDYDEFFHGEDEDYEREKEQRKKNKTFITRIVGSLLVVALLVSGLTIWPQIINLPAIDFLASSARLSQNEDVKHYKKAVVAIEHDQVKGTGFNVNAEGLIVTNEHVVNNAKRVKVHFKGGESYTGKVVYTDEQLDLAIVDIEGHELPYLKISYESKWKGEDSVIFIGNPLSFTQIANKGEIIGNVLLEDHHRPVMMIKAPIYKGNSGSPVVNTDGEVIGVIFATLRNPDVETDEIIGVATPATYLEPIIKEWEK